MADSNTRISGPVTVHNDAKERVAFDLMMQISGYEEVDQDRPRQYWLELFVQCMKATYQSLPEKTQERPRK